MTTAPAFTDAPPTDAASDVDPFDNIKFTVVAPKGQSTSSPTVALDDIPQNVRKSVEEAWTDYFGSDTYDGGMLSVTFPDKATKFRWLALAQSYAALRKDAGAGEALFIRQSPVRGAPEGQLTIRIRTMADEDKRKADAKVINDAAKAAKAAEAAKDPKDQKTSK